jgi:hypothetical protein
VVRIRSNVPDARSRCIVMAVMMNITKSGKRPSRIKHALLNGVGAPGRCGALWNMKYINVITRTGTTSIIAMLRWSAASCRRIRNVVAPYGFRDPFSPNRLGARRCA